MKKQLWTVAGMASIGLLSACGGGSDSTSSAESGLDKYVGTWIDPCTVISPNPKDPKSEHQTYTITKIDDTHLTDTFQGYLYASTDCSGAATPSYRSVGNLTFVGTKSVPQGSAEKFQLTADGESPRNEISMVLNGRLYPVGNPDKLGADGFPEEIVLEYVFTKQ